jgi:hypothetical protein
MGQIAENELRRFGFIPVRCPNVVCGTFVERLFPYCFDITNKKGQWLHCG